MVRLKSYENLYIYTVHGEIPGAPDHFADALAIWEDSGTTLLFFESAHEDAVKEFIADNCPDAEYLSETVIDYSNWEAGKPVTATSVAGFLICPTWDIREPANGEIRILMDPGVAFGSGLHPTTRCCLKALRIVFEHDCPGRVLDLGCGTGILSVATRLLGAKSCTMVDYTPMATDTAATTLELNKIDSAMTIINGDALNNLHHEADLLVSNIYIQVIKELFKREEYTSRKWLLLSGIHGKDQNEDILGMINNSGRTIVESWEDAGWYTYLTGRRMGHE